MRVSKFVCVIVVFMMFFTGWFSGQSGLDSAYAAELVIITPYRGESGLQDSLWNTYANSLARHKNLTGMTTEVISLDDINRNYDGIDEAEKVKRAIYDRVINQDTRYVLLVGDTGIFPVRYQYVGYRSDGLISYVDNRTREPSFCNDDQGNRLDWCPYIGYYFLPCDGYYANLWDNADQDKTFDDWNREDALRGNDFIGEMYFDNARGTGSDQISIHPDVAVGRVPAQTPEEFLAYIAKVIRYERFIVDSERANTGLFIGTQRGGSQSTKHSIAEYFGNSGITFFFQDEDGSYYFDDDNETDPCPDPLQCVVDFIHEHNPNYLNYAGHGAPMNWYEVPFTTFDASRLENYNAPVIIGTASCSTGRFAERVVEIEPPAVATTSTLDIDSMAEGFITLGGNGVIYIGAVTTTQSPQDYSLDKAFFEPIANGVAMAGDAWLEAIEAFIVQYDLDNFTHVEFVEDDDWPDGIRCKSLDDRLSLSRFYHIFKTHFFGDPSLRLHGVSTPVTDNTPPLTHANCVHWANKEDQRTRRHTFSWEIEFEAHDAESDVLATFSRLNQDLDNPQYIWQSWRVGQIALITLPPLNQDLEGHFAECQYYSMDIYGNTEPIRTTRLGYDFTPPVSTAIADGQELPVSGNNEVTIRDASVTITATDNVSGIREIRYQINNGNWTSESGNHAEIQFPACFPMSVVLKYYAVDHAGNAEDEKQIQLHVSPIPGAFISCFDRPVEELYQWPPSLQDTLPELQFRETLAGVLPSQVRFESSGPVTNSYPGHLWTNLGQAQRNPQTQTWGMIWNTTQFGIDNGWYLVRAVTTIGKEEVAFDPFPVLINNLNSSQYTFNVVIDQDQIMPGQTLDIRVIFTNQGLGRMENVAMTLILDSSLLDQTEPSALTRKRNSVQSGETWVNSFTLPLAQSLPPLYNIPIHAFLTSQEFAYLKAEHATFSVLPSDANVSGIVVDPQGHPLPAVVRLRNKTLVHDTETDSQGEYHLVHIPAGTYILEVLQAPEHYQQVVPFSQTYQVVIEGNDLKKNFIFAPPDKIAPTITQELPWREVTAFGYLYGVAYDNRWGTGIDTIHLAIDDLLAYRSSGSQANWTVPQHKLTIRNFIENIHSLLPKLPEQRREQEKARLEMIQKRLDPDCPVHVWLHVLDDSSVLNQGWKLVRAKVTDIAGNESQMETANFSMTADFNISPFGGPAPLTIQFEDTSTGLIAEREWNFGDGETDASRNPTHTYEVPGTYSVTLTINGPYASDTATKEILVTVGGSGEDPDGNYDVVPEPSTILLFSTGLIAVLALMRKRFKR